MAYKIHGQKVTNPVLKCTLKKISREGPFVDEHKKDNNMDKFSAGQKISRILSIRRFSPFVHYVPKFRPGKGLREWVRGSGETPFSHPASKPTSRPAAALKTK